MKANQPSRRTTPSGAKPKIRLTLLLALLATAGLARAEIVPSTTLPKDASVSLGATVLLNAPATTDDPPLSRQWQHNGTNLNLADSPWLRLTNVTELDAGEYRAIFSDAAGNTATSRVATLTIDPTFVRMTPLVASSDFFYQTWVDLEGDGWLDLVSVGGYLTPGGSPLYVYQNNRDGTLTRVTTNSLAQITLRGFNLCWGDYDSDGDLDAFAGGWEAESPLYLRNEGAGKFTPTKMDQYWSANGIDVRGLATATADYDADGQLDVMMGFWGNAAGKWGTNRVLHGVGGGRFEVDLDSPLALTGVWPETFAWVDYDDDGDVDLFCATSGNDTQKDYLFQNLGQGRFERVTDSPLVKIPDLSVGQAWGDYDNDGDLDVLLGNWNQTSLLYQNLGGGAFQLDPAGPVGKPSDVYGVAGWADYDNDGWLDLFLAQLSGLSRMFHNRGDGTLEEVLTGSPVQEARGLGMGWGDYDNDGFVDLAVHDGGQSVNRLYRNNLKQAGNNNHWLKVKLQGVASNRDGIGATVRVKATIGGKTFWQRRQIVSQTHQLDLLAHFGLGDATTVETLRIEWPSGNVQELTDVTPDQLLKVTETVPITPANPFACLGGTVLLSRPETGIDDTFQWQFNGIDLADQTGMSLHLTDLVAADAGRYSVVVSSATGIITNFVYLHVDTQFTKITTDPVVTDTGTEPHIPAWGDINGDGFLDLIIADGGRLDEYWPTAEVLERKVPLVYLNSQDGTFRRALEADIGPLATSEVAGAMANWADYDNDGRLDYFQEAWLEPCRVFRGEPDGKFSLVTADIGINQPLPGWGPWGYSWVDYDRDGFLDLYLTTGWTDSKTFDQLFRNRGNGTFEKADSHYFAGMGDSQYACWADYDDDGDPDVMVGSMGFVANLFRNEGGGRFSDVSARALTETPTILGAWGDYDQDGDLDLLSGKLFANDGQGRFVVKTGNEAPGNGISTWVDYDNDGCLDAFVSDFVTWRRYLYRYDRDTKTFQEVKLSGLSLDPMAVAGFAWADYDNDGFQDLVICTGRGGGTSRLYHNNGNGNHWLLVKLIGTASNRDAIGAKVRAQASIGGKVTWQMQELSGDSMVGERRAHFGLRNATNVTTLRIEWPSGTVQELANIAANQILTIWEPPALKAVVQPDGACALNIRAEPNRAWQIQASDDLLIWQTLDTVTPTAMPFTFTDTAAVSMDGRFYRVFSPE